MLLPVSFSKVHSNHNPMHISHYTTKIYIGKLILIHICFVGGCMKEHIKKGDVKIGSRVRELREIRGMTQKMLADKVMVSGSCITRLESGETIMSIFSLIKIADVLDVGIEEILKDYTRYEQPATELDRLVRRIKKLPLEKQKKIISAMEQVIDLL